MNSSKNETKETIAERIVSILPAKLKASVKNIERTALTRKERPRIVKPVKPTLPDLYQENPLYFESRSTNTPIRIRNSKKPIKEDCLKVFIASVRKSIESHGSVASTPASSVSKNLSLCFFIKIDKKAKKKTNTPQNQKLGKNLFAISAPMKIPRREKNAVENILSGL